MHVEGASNPARQTHRFDLAREDQLARISSTRRVPRSGECGCSRRETPMTSGCRIPARAPPDCTGREHHGAADCTAQPIRPEDTCGDSTAAPLLNTITSFSGSPCRRTPALRQPLPGRRWVGSVAPCRRTRHHRSGVAPRPLQEAGGSPTPRRSPKPSTLSRRRSVGRGCCTHARRR
jgi:hypothetical protein